MKASEEVDILIIGAGASGAAAAWSLSENNYSIVCLEQGGILETNDFPSSRVNWEIEKEKKYNVSPNKRNLQSDYPINDKNSPISIANYNAVGGSMVLYSGHFPRLHPSDFKVKTLDKIGDDWPIDYADLEPFYNLNDKMMGVSGLVDDPAYPPMSGLLPPVPIGKAGEAIVKGFNLLGWHIWPSYSAIITRPYGGRDKCINLGPCNTGCTQRAKSSVDITYWPLARRNGVVLKPYCRVRKIKVNNSGLATGAIYFDENGLECFQKAKIVLLACNGVGTPRILLNSKSKMFPNGLANNSGLVGKNLMLHPLGFVEGIFQEDLESYLGPHGCCLLSQEFYETDLSRGFTRGFTMQILRGPGPIETAVSGYTRRKIKIGSEHHKSFRELYGRTMGMGIIIEDLPEVSNEVILDSELTDSNGIPSPKINYTLSDNSKKMMSFGIKKGKEAFEAAGAKLISGFGPIRNSGWHLMGTTKMGLNPDSSVVNKYGQTHDVKNLFILDSSVFVTSGGVNPASTIQAFSLYASDYIKNNLKINSMS